MSLSFLVFPCSPERGLVSGGQYNLGLFCRLFWVVVVAFLAVQYTIWPLAFVLRGMYVIPEGTKGRACLLEEHREVIAETEKTNMMSIVFPALVVFFFTWQRFSCKRFLAGLCPRGRMSCVGKYKRNVLTLDDTYFFLIANSFCRIGGTFLGLYASRLSPVAHFWVWNSTATLWTEGFYLMLPFFLTAPESCSETVVFAHFYVRKPSLEPRRDNWTGSREVMKRQHNAVLAKESKILPVLRRSHQVRPSQRITAVECN
jgi:hypothetical protein